jgi:hypothetical protein
MLAHELPPLITDRKKERLSLPRSTRVDYPEEESSLETASGEVLALLVHMRLPTPTPVPK